MNTTLETNIMIALFKATVEQSTFLKDELKQKPKQVFNTWQSQGNTLLNHLEERNIANEEYIDSLTGVIHNIIHEIRKQNEGFN